MLQSQKKENNNKKPVLKHYPENDIVRHSPHILYFVCIFFSYVEEFPHIILSFCLENRVSQT